MKLLFAHKQPETKDVWSFIFKPREPLAWVAGQSLRIEVPGPYGPLEHRFSIASAPSSGIVMITTRLSDSDYKESLTGLQQGAVVDAYGLEGDFIWREHPQPPIFVAAGIGITPFSAILTERAQQNQAINATLLYSSRDEPPIFRTRLDTLAHNSHGFTVRYKKERVSAAEVLEQPVATERLIYISGPSKMVDTLGADLIAAGINPAQILRDQFTGRLPLDG